MQQGFSLITINAFYRSIVRNHKVLHLPPTIKYSPSLAYVFQTLMEIYFVFTSYRQTKTCRVALQSSKSNINFKKLLLVAVTLVIQW